VLFPAEILPIVTVLANMMHFFLGLPILALFLIYYRVPIQPLDLLWLPLVIAVQFVFTTALALLVSALTVHFRDIKDILANLLTFWFFATPIIYPLNTAPPAARQVLLLNPFTHLALSYQEILFHRGPYREVSGLLVLAVLSLVLFAFGFFLFDRLRDTFAEEV